MNRRPRGRPAPLPVRSLAAATVPTVTVVIPCSNYARYLPQAVRSALDQPGVRVDVVVVDDCSPDESLAVARELAADDSRVQVLANERNLGPVGTFNRGLAAATGEYVVRLDADDLLVPGSLARAVAVGVAHPNVGLVYGRPVHFEGDVPATHVDRVDAWTVWPGMTWLRDRCRTGTNVITSPEVVMRRSVVEVVGGQRDLAHAHDMEMWFRLAAVADVAYLDGPDQAWHRDHAASLSTAVDDDFGLHMLEERRRAFVLLFDGERVEIAAGDDLRHVAMGSLAAEALRRAAQHVDRGRGDAPQVAALFAFAVETSPPVTATRRWRVVRRRAARPAWHRWWMPWCFARAYARRLENDARRRHWRRWGVETG